MAYAEQNAGGQKTSDSLKTDVFQTTNARNKCLIAWKSCTNPARQWYKPLISNYGAPLNIFCKNHIVIEVKGAGKQDDNQKNVVLRLDTSWPSRG